MNRNCAFFCINLSRELLLWIFSVNLEEKKKKKKREWKSNQGQNQGGRSSITTGRIYSLYNCDGADEKLAGKNSYSKSVRRTLDPRIQLKVKFDRPPRTEGIISTRLRHDSARQILAAWTGRRVQYISNFRGEGGSDRNELIREEDRQQFAS